MKSYILAAAILALLLVSCTQKISSEKEFAVIAKQFEFVPGEIVVDRGDHVTIRIKSVDVTHGFAIPEYDINEMLNPGEGITVSFIADKPGNFTFFCSVPCGSGHNSMQGRLVVK